MRAKKSLGQHFLHSQGALEKIVNAADLSPSDVVLEIGPGKGVLTERLLEKAGKVIAVEKDDGLYELLQEKFKDEIKANKLVLIHDDILEFDLESLNQKYKLVANIPYNITGAILEKFLSDSNQPVRVVLLVQREVAQRIVARDNKESILSISVKAYGTPKYVATVKAGSFVPVPKVDSAILLVEDISKAFFDPFSETDFFNLLRLGFASKRKKLSSNLAKQFLAEKVGEVFTKLEFDTNLRAEDLKVTDWRILAINLL